MAATDASKVPGGWLGFWLGILVTAGLVTALVVAWPDDAARALRATSEVTPTTRYGPGVVPELPELPDVSVPTGPAAQLFVEGLPSAVTGLLDSDHWGGELDEMAVYPSYVIVTHPDASDPSRLVRRTWRDEGLTTEAPTAAGATDAAALFPMSDVDLDRIPELVADAPTHYTVPVEVTHVLIDRFLPFDERVLVRVYASPPGDPSGGGYVGYTADGTVVRVCC